MVLMETVIWLRDSKLFMLKSQTLYKKQTMRMCTNSTYLYIIYVYSIR